MKRSHLKLRLTSRRELFTLHWLYLRNETRGWQFTAGVTCWTVVNTRYTPRGATVAAEVEIVDKLRHPVIAYDTLYDVTLYQKMFSRIKLVDLTKIRIYVMYQFFVRW